MLWTTRSSLLLLTVALSLASAKAQTAPEGLNEAARRTIAEAPPSYAPYPQPEAGYVTDMAGLLTAEQKETLNAYCYTAEKETDVEVVVVTINSIRDYPGTADSSIESFAKGLFDKYGIGNMPRNDGVLLLVARQDRKARIEMGAHYGHGRDGDARRIMDRSILPSFRKDKYAAGIDKGTRAIIEEFAGMRISFPWRALVYVVAAAVLGAVAVSLFRNGKRGWGWIVAGIAIMLLVFAFKSMGKVIEQLPSGSGAGGFGGGFGGGFSGGGGATGSW